MKKNQIKWTPATPVRRTDCIISSKARENNEIGFIPSYEKEPTENMYFILSHEYFRIWLKERSQYELDTYSKLEVEAGGSDIKRRYVQRYIRPRPVLVKQLPSIKLQRFAQIAAKVDAKR
ncbi:hypothetical protein PPYR_08933 [Photinus pyralis]|uniref:Uncharacterized protein n=2 Tax=Photinus pyralis TaxID=7054 RepID=A0A5N4AKR8_PHOPY|nr:uncharacterized protein LOC116170166 [Photinus pyralis]KAB0797940.1 hypothetical protein PPYR_08933 [Photinus pyralis]